ncbi:DUF6685 family protein (plasmid) [Campylobacter fetus]|uniref:DUF6685 family protein n=1 Tax=Campylobacter fetus TaxID=196 RepID=UPI0012CF453F|nr:DUF6685 family protein [Campylobacter fetus]KAA3682652.1 hypothetical protein E3U40_09830 [Campylobacter fetus subsp. venerealis]
MIFYELYESIVKLNKNIKKSLETNQIYEKIINLPFEKINKCKLNLDCFNSDNVSFFIKPKNCYSRKQRTILEDIIQIEESNNIIELDLKRINSISSSKSKSSGYKYKDIYEFGKNVFVERNKKWSLEECIKHTENGLGNKEKIYEIRYYKWNNRYEWLNSDGSHHFAVANYIITNKNINYKIKCQITTYSIKEELKTIIDNYCMFLINDKLQYHLYELFLNTDINIILLESNNCLILIKKNETYKNLIQLMKIIDNKYIFYLNDYLNEKVRFSIQTLKNSDFKLF